MLDALATLQNSEEYEAPQQLLHPEVEDHCGQEDQEVTEHSFKVFWGRH